METTKTQSSIYDRINRIELANGLMPRYFIGETIQIDNIFYSVDGIIHNYDAGFICYKVQSSVID